MTIAKFYLYIGLFFLSITLIGLGLIIFGIYIISAYDELVPTATNAIIMGIILVPIGSIFTAIFFYQSYYDRKQQKHND